MLEKEKAIDAVLIATPDHLHAYVSILAMKAGKHVYCEKPLTHNIREARLVARVAKETGVATQMGNQGRSGEGHRQTVEWIKDGAIGTVREVHAWSGTPRTAKAAGRARGRPRSPPGSTGICGSARAPTGPTAGSSRRSSGAGCGTSATARCPTWRRTTSIPAFNALGLDVPETIEAGPPSSTRGDARQQPGHLSVRGEGRPGPLTVFWYDNGLKPPTPRGLDPDDPGSGSARATTA